MTENGQPDGIDLADLKERLEDRTGFPAELYAASICMGKGWKCLANPRFASDDRSTDEIDLVATFDPPLNQSLTVTLNGGWFTVTLVIEVKSYNRPVIAFCSPKTSLDAIFSYGLIGRVKLSNEAVTHYHPAMGLRERLYPNGFARTLVVMNSKGDSPKDFDLNQISSAVRGVYKACRAVRDDYIQTISSLGERGERLYYNVIIPVLILNGNLCEYRLDKTEGTLQHTGLIALNSNIIGRADELDASPAFVVRLGLLDQFLTQIEIWATTIQ